MSSRPDLMAGVRLRVPLVFVIPILAILLIGVTAVGVALVLLNIPKEAATVVALALAINILGACAVLALRRRTDAGTMSELLVVASYPFLIGLVLALVGFGGGEEAAGHGENGGGASGENRIVAANVQFDKDEVTFPSQEETQFELVNDDSVVHNFSIYRTEQAQRSLFVGQNVAAASSITYTIPAMEAGEYFFRCDLHPTSMVGTAIVE